MREYTTADLEALKAKWGPIVELEVPEFGIKLPLMPFTVPTFDRWVDEGLRDHETAVAGVFARHVLFYPPAEREQLRKQCRELPQKALDVLCADAGWPLPDSGAAFWVDELAALTPPGVLGEAGLDEATAETLRARLQGEGRKGRIVRVQDQDRQIIFACVIGSPGEGEQHILATAEKKREGYGAACRSAADGCIAWAREAAYIETWKRYPAIPVMILAPEVKRMGGGSATRRFRRS